MKYYLNNKEITLEELKSKKAEIARKNSKEESDWEEYGFPYLYEAGNGWQCREMIVRRIDDKGIYFGIVSYEQF